MKILIFLFILIGIECNAQLQINEVCSDNDALLPANNGNYYDWVEIYNSSDEPINLSDYYLSDDESKLKKWNFNPEIIQAKSFVLVFASDVKNTPNQQHANFKLSSNGESVYLSSSQGLIDSMSFGVINEDYSYGRLEESSYVKTHLAIPTPGTANSGSGTVITNYESGYYDKEFDLELEAAKGQKIYYTTNGDDPTLESKLYDGKIRIKDEYEVYEYLDVPTTPADSFECMFTWKKALNPIRRCNIVSYRVIFKNGVYGKTHSQSFFANKIHQLPIISIVTDNKNLFDSEKGIFVPGDNWTNANPCASGNYKMSGEEWEREISYTYFEQYQLLANHNGGMRIHGSGSRVNSQKSFRLYARKKYGINKFPNVYLNNIETKEFNSFIVRSTMNDHSGVLIKDAITMESIRNLDLEQTFIQPVVVYINGNYWGIQEIRNRLDEDYLADKYGLNKDSITISVPAVWNTPWEMKDYKIREVYEFLVEKDLTISDNYNFVKNNFNIPQLIDYYVAQTFFANSDWPGNNFLMWNSNEDSKFKPLFFDLDGGWVNKNFDMLKSVTQLETNKYPNPSKVNIIFKKLLDNQEFRQQFIDRALYLVENEFSNEQLKPIVDKYVSIYEIELENNINRWSYPKDEATWRNLLFIDIYEFARQRECYYKQHLVEHFNLDPNLLCNPTSVNASDSQTFTISPNPANNVITLHNINSLKVEIISLEGTKIMEIPSKGLSQIEINISNLVPSIYIAKTDTKTVKFVVIK